MGNNSGAMSVIDDPLVYYVDSLALNQVKNMAEHCPPSSANSSV
jgi:hypothetical protein